ncbi:precorrin-4 C11-methyltransferase [Desulfobulbus propionicus DSM 2032]|jgi:precorrin-4/cobalt-precorrin-4 C11-methyltransferase|uniref:Precorrin-4 C11-methyltransferase n=1 Tax=Desulfobulbus propionicus (strain ATCC 33891 / DSM 2032 / VKM B-1956 / 1pr3) TaxID=577650 RepID=A0A7U3YPH8_DESPD|nr:precorrin-4 C(11)-methyltransferase [Desulfobulbus propionicus]ADW19153.1 precorrin-4 C11-methyltransferase [Desulfobulbus propionicus DSM 2032]
MNATPSPLDAVLHPVVFLGAGPGDPELITLKGRRLLDQADVVVYAGSLVNPALLDGIAARCHDSASLDLDTIMQLLADGYRQGLRVVRLHTGDPAIYGAIREQMQWLDAQGIPYEVVPGVSSAFASAAALKVELTVPEVTQTVIFTRQAGRTPVPERESLRNLARAQATMCIFLSVSLIATVVDDLISGGYAPETPIAVVERASWPDQQIVRGRLDDIAAHIQASRIKKTAMIVVGPALGEDSHIASKLYDASFSHEYR